MNKRIRKKKEKQALQREQEKLDRLLFQFSTAELEDIRNAIGQFLSRFYVALGNAFENISVAISNIAIEYKKLGEQFDQENSKQDET